MAASAAQTRLTPEEYIAFERKAPPDVDANYLCRKSTNASCTAKYETGGSLCPVIVTETSSVHDHRNY